MQNYSIICSKHCIRRYETKPDSSGLNSSSKTLIGASDTLRRVTSLELIKVRDQKGDLGTEFHSILARWRNYCSQQLSVHGVNYARQTEI